MLSMCGLLCRMLRGWRHSEAVMLMAKALSQPQSSLLIQNINSPSSSGPVTVNEPSSTSSFCQNSNDGTVGQMLWRDNNKQAVIVIPRQKVNLKRWTLFLASSNGSATSFKKDAPTSTAENPEPTGEALDGSGTVTILLEAAYRDHESEIVVDHHVMVEHLSTPYAWKARDTFGVIVTATPSQLLAMIQAFFNNALLIDDDFLITKILTVDLIGEASTLEDPASIPESVTPGLWTAEKSGLTQLEIARSISPTNVTVYQLPAIAAKDLEARSNTLHPPSLSNSLRHQSSENSTEDTTSTTLNPQSSSDSDKHPFSLDPQSSYESVSDYPTSDTDDIPCNVYQFYPRGWAISGARVVSGQPLSVRGVLSQLDGNHYKRPCSIVTNPLEDLWQDNEDTSRIKAGSCTLYSLQHASCLNGPSKGQDDKTALLKVVDRESAGCVSRYKCISSAAFCRTLQFEPSKTEREIVREAAEHYRRALNSSQERREWVKKSFESSGGEEEASSINEFSFRGTQQDTSIVTREPKRSPIRIKSEADLSRATSLIKDNLANIVENYLVKQSGSPDFQYQFPKVQMENPTLKLPCTFSPSRQTIFMNGRVTEIRDLNEDQVIHVEESGVVPIVVTEIKTPVKDEPEDENEEVECNEQISHGYEKKEAFFRPSNEWGTCKISPMQPDIIIVKSPDRILPRIPSDSEEPFLMRANKHKSKLVSANIAGVHGVRPKETCKPTTKNVKKLVKSEELGLPTMKREGRIDIPVGQSIEIDISSTSKDMCVIAKEVSEKAENSVAVLPNLQNGPQEKNTMHEECVEDRIITADESKEVETELVALEIQEEICIPSDDKGMVGSLICSDLEGAEICVIRGLDDIIVPLTVESFSFQGDAVDKDSEEKGDAVVKDSEEKGDAVVKDSEEKGDAVDKDSEEKGDAVDKDSEEKGIGVKSVEVESQDVDEMVKENGRNTSIGEESQLEKDLFSDKEIEEVMIAECHVSNDGTMPKEQTWAGISIVLEGKMRDPFGATRDHTVITGQSESEDFANVDGDENIDLWRIGENNEEEIRMRQKPRCLKQTHKLDTKSSTASESSFESLPYKLFNSQSDSLTDDVIIELSRAPIDSEKLRRAKQELIRLERMNAISMASQYLTESKDDFSPEDKDTSVSPEVRESHNEVMLDLPGLSNSAHEDDPNQDMCNSSLFDSGVEGTQSEQNSSGGSSIIKILPSPVESTTESGFSSLKEQLPHETLIAEDEKLCGQDGVSLSKSKDSLDLTDTDRFLGTDTLSDDMETLSSTAGDMTLVESDSVSKEGSARGSMSDSFNQESAFQRMYSSEQPSVDLDSFGIPSSFEASSCYAPCDMQSKFGSVSLSNQGSLDSSPQNTENYDNKNKVCDDIDEFSQATVSTNVDDKSKYSSDDGSVSKMKTSESISSEDTVISRISLEEHSGKVLRQGSQEDPCEVMESQMHRTPIEEKVTDGSQSLKKVSEVSVVHLSSIKVGKDRLSSVKQLSHDSGISETVHQIKGEHEERIHSSNDLERTSQESVSGSIIPCGAKIKTSSFSVLGEEGKRASVADLIEMYDSKANLSKESVVGIASTKSDIIDVIEKKTAVGEAVKTTGVKCDIVEDVFPCSEAHSGLAGIAPARKHESTVMVVTEVMKRKSDVGKKSDVSDRSSPNNHETCSTSDRPSRHSSKSGVSDLEDEVFLPPCENYILDGRPVIYCPKIDMSKQVKVEPPKMAMSVFTVVPSKELGSSKSKDWRDLGTSGEELPILKDTNDQLKNVEDVSCKLVTDDVRTVEELQLSGEKELGIKTQENVKANSSDLTDTIMEAAAEHEEIRSFSSSCVGITQNVVEQSRSKSEAEDSTISQTAKPLVKDITFNSSKHPISPVSNSECTVSHGKPTILNVRTETNVKQMSELPNKSRGSNIVKSASLSLDSSSRTQKSSILKHTSSPGSLDVIPIVTEVNQPLVSPSIPSDFSPNSTYDPFTGSIIDSAKTVAQEDDTNTEKQLPKSVEGEISEQTKPVLSRVPNIERKDTDVDISFIKDVEFLPVQKVEIKIFDNSESQVKESPVVSPVSELKKIVYTKPKVCDDAVLVTEKKEDVKKKTDEEKKAESRSDLLPKEKQSMVGNGVKEENAKSERDSRSSADSSIKMDSKTSEESDPEKVRNQSSIESSESTVSCKSETKLPSKGQLDRDINSLRNAGWCVGGSLEFLEKHSGEVRRRSKHGSITSAKSEDLSLKCDKVSLKSQDSLDKFTHFDQVTSQQKPRGARRKILSIDIDTGEKNSGDKKKEMHRSATLPVGSLAGTKKEKDDKKEKKDEKSKKKKKDKEGSGSSEKKSTMMSLKGLLKRNKTKEKDKEKDSSQEKLSSPSLFRKFDKKSRSSTQSPSLEERKSREKGKVDDSPSRDADKIRSSPVSVNGKTRPVISSPVSARQVGKPMDPGIATAIRRSSAALGTSGSDSESPAGSLQSSPKRILSHPRKASLGNQPSPRLYRHVLTRHLSSSQESVDNPILSSTHSSPQTSPHTSPKRMKMPASASSYSLPASRDMSPPAPVMGTRALRGSSNSFSVTIGFKPTVEKRSRTMSEGADLNKTSASPVTKRKEGSRILTQLNKRSSSMEILVCGKIREHCSDGGKSPSGSPFSREGSFRLHREISVETLFELPETSPRSNQDQKDYQEYLEELHARNDSHHGSSCSLFEDSEVDRRSDYFQRRSSHHSPAGKKLSLPHNMHLSGLREIAASNPNLHRSGSPFIRGLSHSSSFTSSPYRRPHSSAAAFSPAKRGLSTNTGGPSPPGDSTPGTQLMRVEEEGLCRKNIDSETEKPPNVLVYAANKNEYFAAVRETLKKCLNQDRYTIYQLTDEMAFKSPWAGSTTLLVVCGDVPAHISTVFIRFLLQGGRVLSVCSDFLNMAVPLFGTVEVQEQAVVSVSYHNWSGVQLLHHQHCFHSSPQHKRFSREVEKPKVIPSRSAVSVEPTHVEITDEWGGRHRLVLTILATDDTWGAPSLLSAKLQGGKGRAVFSQVHLEQDPRECFGASELSEKLSSSNESRLEILKDLLSNELNMDTTSTNTESLFTSAYFLGRHELKQDLLRKLKSHMDGQELKRPLLNMQFITSGVTAKKPDESTLPVYMNACPMTFSTVKYFEALNTTIMGRLMLYCDVITSTMRVTAGHPPLLNGLAVVACQQTEGKGRSGNSWLSPLGCAMFTIQLHIPLSSTLGQYLSFIQHLIAIAVADAVRDQPGYNDIPVNLKWPNDIYISNNLKIGGVIVEATTVGDTVIANIGCGVNLSNSNPTYCINDAVRQYNKDHDVRLPELEKEVFLARTFNAFEKIINEFQKDGPEAVLPKYYKYWLHSNTTVIVQNENFKSESAVITGVDSYGFLVAQLVSGASITLHPDGNSFNMMEGLIYSKYHR